MQNNKSFFRAIILAFKSFKKIFFLLNDAVQYKTTKILRYNNND